MADCRGSSPGRRALIIVGAMLTCFALAETGLRYVYRRAEQEIRRFPVLYEREYWTVPPWIKHASIMYRDPVLGGWMRPGIDRTYINLFGPIGDIEEVDAIFSTLRPVLPEWVLNRPAWTLKTNSLGIRGREILEGKPAGGLRIVVAGDSWTVGVNVAEQETFSRRLEETLRGRFPGRAIEVINYGRIGGSTRNLETVLRERVWPLDPDCLVLAYAQNDEYGFHVDPKSIKRAPGPARRIAQASELFNLIAYELRPAQDTLLNSLKNILETPWTRPDNAAPDRCERPGLSSTPYARAMAAAVDEAKRRGIDVILLYNAMPNGRHCALTALRGVASDKKIPLIDSSAALGREAKRLEENRERDLRLRPRARLPAAPGRVGVVFRVLSEEKPARPVTITGNSPVLGAWVPNKVLLFDDGTYGDQAAGDGVWSRRFDFPADEEVIYLFTMGSQPGRWTDVENYWSRKFRTLPRDAGKTVYAPVARFGEQVLRSDPFHTDRRGHEIIARALLGSVMKGPAFKSWSGNRAP